MTATRTFNRTRGAFDDAVQDALMGTVVGSVGSLLNKMLNADSRNLVVVIDQAAGKVHAGVKATLATNSGWGAAVSVFDAATRAKYEQSEAVKFETGQQFSRTAGAIPGDDSEAPLLVLSGSITAMINKMLDICSETALIIADQGTGEVWLCDADASGLQASIDVIEGSGVMPISYTVAAAKAFE